MTTINRIVLPTPFVLDEVNCYYIHDSVPTLIDAGVDTEEAFEVLKSGIGNFGGSIEGIARIILTHAHADHIGMLSRLVESSGAEVFIHRLDAPKMIDSGQKGAIHLREKYKAFFAESGAPEDLTEEILATLFKRLKRYFRPFEAVKPLSGSEFFSFDDFVLEILHTPGHSPGSICVFNRDNGTLFSGDSLLEKITSNPVVEVNPSSDNQGYRSLERFIQTLHFLNELPANMVLPGHGNPFSNHRRRVEELLDHHEERTEQIIKILQGSGNGPRPKQGMTRFMMTEKLFNDLKGMDVFLGLSEIKGHLEILESQGIVITRNESGHVAYSVQND